MQENLVGYLLGALEADEHETVKSQIESNPEVRRELESLESRLAPLQSQRWQEYDPPKGLAAATCALVAEVAADSAAIDIHRATPRSRMSPTFEPPRRGASWSLMDMVVTAGIFAAISCLFLPSIGRSLDTAKVMACQNNLQGLYGGLSQFSTVQNGVYPTALVRPNYLLASAFAPQLVEPKYASASQIACPSQLDSRTVALRVPPMTEFQQQQKQRADFWSVLRKVYGYNIGYVDEDGRYHRPSDRGRNYVPLVADLPTMTPYGPANNGHGGHGMNVLMEDGSVKTLPPGVCTIGSDNIFLNDEGIVGPGVDENDSVIGPSIRQIKIRVRFVISPEELRKLPPELLQRLRERASNTTNVLRQLPESTDSTPLTEL